VLSTTVGLVFGVGVGTGISFAVDFSSDFLGVLSFTIFGAAPGIMSAMPFRIEAASLSPFTRTISSASTQ
jgi:hypothetical protein